MLNWFKDAALTLPITGTTPKWVSVPTKGGVKTTSVWLGDNYTTLISQPTGLADTTIYLTQITELSPTGGIVFIGSEEIAYTGLGTTPSPNITGCTRGYNSTVAASYVVGTVVYPQTVYPSVSGNITILINNMTAGPVRLGLATASGVYGPAGAPLLLSASSVTSGVAGAIQINLQFTAPANLEQKFTNLSITPTLLTHPTDHIQAAFTMQPPCLLYVQQRDQGLVQRMRLLPLNRRVLSNLPGFAWGQYRWRDNTTENSVAIVPTRWDTDTSRITQEFQGGVGSVGETNDLQPIDLEEIDSSVYLRALHGQYFTGVKRYYYPSNNWNLEFLPSTLGGSLAYQLQKPPREQTPVFVGNWRLDGQGFYEYNLNARYTFGSHFNPTDTVNPQFKVDRNTGILTVNPACQGPRTTILLGVLAGAVTEYFDIPFYPVDNVLDVYTGGGIHVAGVVFNREQGYVTFPKVAGGVAGDPIFASITPALAVEYEYDVADMVEIQNTNIPDEQVLRKDIRLLNPDLNPAFAGISSGYVYLQHRVLRPIAVQLSADKPQIAIPPTLSSIIGLIAYGPVYYSGDHALLTAKAIGSLPNEVIPGAQLRVIPGGYNPANGQPLQTYPFRGLINGLDPNTTPVIVVTGSDGIANLVYQPENDFGFYIPTTAPWITSSFTETPVSVVWTAPDLGPPVIPAFATVVLSSLSHEYTVGGNLRLTGFTPAAWDGDWQIETIDPGSYTLTINMPNDPGTETIMGKAGPTDTITLPVPIAISQLWSAPPTNEGWLDYVYPVLSNQPLFGLSSLPLTGNADVTTGTATVQVVNNPPITLAAGNPITIANATSSILDGSWVLESATLTSGVWTVTFARSGSLSSTPQIAGSLIATGAVPFIEDGVVSGAVTVLTYSYGSGTATFNLATAPINLELGQNIQITGCGALNGIQNVLTIVGDTITTPASGTGSGSGGTITYSNFRTNGVLTEWNKILPSWAASYAYQLNDSIIDSNGNIQTIAVNGTSGGTAPTWGTLFGQSTGDGGAIWTNYGKPGPSTASPIHAYDKNGFDYFDGTFALAGSASIALGLATVTVVQATGDVTITTGDTVIISNATSPSLDGTWTVGTVTGSSPGPGFTTFDFATMAADLPSTPQSTGTMNDISRGFNGDVVQVVFNKTLPNPSQGFVQAYLFQFLEREIIQLQVVDTNIYSNSIMLQMQPPNQLINNPYLVLSTDTTVGHPYYPTPLTDSVLNQNRLGIVTP
jgi:hypothetical protein